MSTITVTKGTLPSPRCYQNEQERYEAYIDATEFSVDGVEWVAQQTAPNDDKSKYWLELDANGRPVRARRWSIADGAWMPMNDVAPRVCTDTGAANASVVSWAAYPFSSLRTNEVLIVKIANANTGACTLKLNNFAAIPIKHGGSDPWENAMAANKWYILLYDGTNWELLNPDPEPPDLVITDKWESTKYPVGSTNTSITIAHNKGKVPFVLRAVFVCKTQDATGFPAGYEVPAECFVGVEGASSNDKYTPVCTYGADTANILVKFGYQGTVKLYSGNAVPLDVTLNSWEAKFYALFI